MSTLAPILESFFTDRLGRQLHASPHTVRAYRDTFRLLLRYAHQHTGKQPSQLDLADLDAPLISRFLDHLEHDRHNTVRTRNARLAAIRSMFRYASYREPAHAGLIQRVLAIPDKRAHHPAVSYLSPAEVDALIAAPDRDTWLGRRDHALLVTAIQTGLRVSELVRPALPRRRARNRCPRPLLRQRPQGALHPAHPSHRQRAARLARRARPRRRPAGVPHPGRRSAQPGLGR